MAQFRGTVGNVSRLGHKASGLTTTCNGWEGGVRVTAEYDADLKQDVFNIYGNNGNGYNKKEFYIGKIIDGEFILS